MNPPLVAQALGRVLQRQHGDTVQVTSHRHEVDEVIALDGERDYVLRLPDRLGDEPAVLLAPDGRATALVLHGVGDVNELVGEVLRRG